MVFSRYFYESREFMRNTPDRIAKKLSGWPLLPPICAGFSFVAFSRPGRCGLTYYPYRVFWISVEKPTPHYDLAKVQLGVARLGVAAFTKTALDGGREMGLTTGEMLAVIAGLKRRNFYKSMTTYADHRIWQDVYHAATPLGQEAYIKITMRDLAPVIQFKENLK
jgi:motility quorum-sensing regulator/GCU-specific mRNA interferase toxin